MRDSWRVHARTIAALGALAAASCSSSGNQVLVGEDAAGVRFDVGARDRPDAGISFVNDVYPIVAASCALAGCHDMAITTNHWTDYTTAESTYTRWVNGPGFDFCSDQTSNGAYEPRTIVIPGDPVDSYLVTKVAPPTEEPCRDPTHHLRMPPAPMDPLPPAAIDTIIAWIKDGALAN